MEKLVLIPARVCASDLRLCFSLKVGFPESDVRSDPRIDWLPKDVLCL